MRFPDHVHTVVVGAGAAGLSAAQTLRQAGIETLVLEAADHVGGRCVTDTTTFSTPFDRGGSWLHSAPINPLARIAEQTGAKLHKQPWARSHVHALGADLSPAQVQDLQDYEAEMWEAIVSAGSCATDQTAKSAMPKGRWSETARHMIPQMLSADADLVSAQDVANYASAKGDWLVEAGLGTFIASLHSDVQVCLDCPVTRIDYSQADVRVTTPHGTLRADNLVVTVSTAVLGAGVLEFNPPLPATKTAAIDMLPCGLLNKVCIEFDPSWHKATQGQMVDYHSSEAEFCSLLFGICDTNLAVGFVAGRFADNLEAQGEGTATDYCLEGLRATFGNDVVKSVLRTDETAWRKNPHAFGSYSYAKPGAADARQSLAAPLAERLYFAGEATMTDTYSTVHGAYLSGKRAADQIISAKPAIRTNAPQSNRH